MTDGEDPGSGPILVCVDFSRGSEAAFAWAVGAALAFDTGLLALHVVHDRAEAPGYYIRAKDGADESIERVAQKMMTEFVASARSRLPRLAEIRRFDSDVVVGLPETRIIEVAGREAASLIAMGAQGHTAISDVLLGSKTERVLHLAEIPVTVVKTAKRADRTTTKK